MLRRASPGGDTQYRTGTDVFSSAKNLAQISPVMQSSSDSHLSSLSEGRQTQNRSSELQGPPGVRHWRLALHSSLFLQSCPVRPPCGLRDAGTFMDREDKDRK